MCKRVKNADTHYILFRFYLADFAENSFWIFDDSNIPTTGENECLQMWILFGI